MNEAEKACIFISTIFSHFNPVGNKIVTQLNPHELCFFSLSTVVFCHIAMK